MKEWYIPAKQRCQVPLHIVGRITAVELPEEDVGALTPAGGPW